MHYEEDEYPEGVEIIDWEKYNLVTSVHPRFYSSNLKKYTDTLVTYPVMSHQAVCWRRRACFRLIYI